MQKPNNETILRNEHPTIHRNARNDERRYPHNEEEEKGKEAKAKNPLNQKRLNNLSSEARDDMQNFKCFKLRGLTKVA